jgi:hypothetical protein
MFLIFLFYAFFLSFLSYISLFLSFLIHSPQLFNSFVFRLVILLIL